MKRLCSLIVVVLVSTVFVYGQDGLDNMLLHYWDTTSPSERIDKDRFIGYTYLLSKIDEKNACLALDAFIDRFSLDDDHAEWALFLMESYLYHPESKFRNERLFRHALSRMKECSHLSAPFRIARTYQWESLIKCMEGEKASDFVITLSSGEKKNLSQFHSDYLILLFYYPNCSKCHTLIDEMTRSEVIASMVKRNQLQVIAIYPLDSDGESWRIPYLPQGWSNGYDSEQAVYSKRLYTLREIPAVYLLDVSDTIVLKECSIRRLNNYLESQ